MMIMIKVQCRSTIDSVFVSIMNVILYTAKLTVLFRREIKIKINEIIKPSQTAVFSTKWKPGKEATRYIL